ncbi:MAG: YgiT-type zinc finger protein [Oscillospiraceae bacterium]|nr:YgiT-type zinc finger protein [Oscillospiraceae bacterium]
MKCISCGAGTSIGITNDVTELEGCLIIVRNVPCHKCSECDEIIYTADVVKHLEVITTAAKMTVNEIAILDYSSKVA